VKLARIAGVDLPKNERIEVGLTRIFGIGRSSARKILEETNVNPNTRVKDLTDEDVVKIRSVIERDYKVEGDLRREISMNIKRLIDIGTYRGLRHKLGLPVRGQRTRTNARTRKGPRKSVMGKKKEA
jgi:small subunit ribosomal protein S13